MDAPLGGRVARGAARLLLSLLTWGLSASLILLAAGTAAGRSRVWPVHGHGAGTGVTSDQALVLAPVLAAQIHDGDLVVMGREHTKPALYRVKAMLDNTRGKAQILDEHGAPQYVDLPAKVWRVSRAVPFAGVALRLIAGPVQAGLLVLAGIVLIARAESRRRREEGGGTLAQPEPPRRWRRSGRTRAAPTS